jgi:hypothetical protein
MWLPNRTIFPNSMGSQGKRSWRGNAVGVLLLGLVTVLLLWATLGWIEILSNPPSLGGFD